MLLVAIVGGGVAWAVHHSNSGSLPTIAVQSPVDTTEAWFGAVNVQNMPLAQAHFASADREQMNWSSWGKPFTDLHCSLTSQSQNSAGVYCTFATQNDPATEMSNVNFWSVHLIRASSGRWLITNYGQG